MFAVVCIGNFKFIRNPNCFLFEECPSLNPQFSLKYIGSMSTIHKFWPILTYLVCWYSSITFETYLWSNLGRWVQVSAQKSSFSGEFKNPVNFKTSVS